jgi:hypothetical protein
MANYKAIGRPRVRLAIGEIVGSPRGWADSYWFVVEHAPDYVSPKNHYNHSAEIVEHYPTGQRRRLYKNGNIPFVKPDPRLYKTVQDHFYSFRRPTRERNGEILDFQMEWNPDRGGSFIRAVWEIEQDIGKRPTSQHHLAVQNHALGFVRGNLKWEPRAENIAEAHIRAWFRKGATLEQVISKVHQIWEWL